MAIEWLPGSETRLFGRLFPRATDPLSSPLPQRLSPSPPHFHGSLSPSLAGGMKTEQQLCLEPENIILSSMIKKLDKLITLQVSPLRAPHLLSSFHLIADGFLSEYG